jgi:hypothetical protein
MSNDPAPGSRRPAYLNAPPPAHFCIRTDLIEELCVADAFERTLPRTPEAYARWIRTWGRSADELPFDAIKPFVGRPYEPTPHYLFHPAILQGASWVQNVLTDGRGWSICCERDGLYDFVINRAAEFAATRGCDKARALALLLPEPDVKSNQGSQHGEWSIGYECATGLCTILARSRDQTELRYLAGQPGYFVPTFK